MTFDYLPYSFITHLKWPSEIGSRMKEFCEYATIGKDVNKEFYLKTLGSLSLSISEKHRIFSSINELANFQIERLEEVFDEELTKFTEFYQKSREDVIKLVFEGLLENICILRMYQIFSSRREEHVIIKKMIGQWVSRDPQVEEYLQPFLQSRNVSPQKILFNYYRSGLYNRTQK